MKHEVASDDMTMADYDDIIDYYRNAACMTPLAPF